MANGEATILSRFDRLVPRQMPSRTSLLYAAWTAGLFVLFLVLTFPHDLVVRRVAERLGEETGWQLRFEDAWLVPWAGYRLSEARLIAPGGDRTPWIGAHQLSLRPSLSTLFGGASAGRFSGEAYGGEFSGWVSLAEPPRVELSWSDFELSRYPRLASVAEGQWGGSFSGEATVVLGDDLRGVEGNGRLRLRNGSLTGGSTRGFTIPDLTATSGDSEFEIKGGRLEIRSLKLTGAEIDAELRGQVYLRDPLPESVVNATLSVKPVPGSPPGLDGLLQMLNKGQRPAGGTYSLTLYGMVRAVKVR